MKTYQKTFPISQTQIDSCFDFIYPILTSNQFQLIERTADTLRMQSPTLNSTSENPLKGLGLLHLQYQNDQLTVTADYQGYKNISKLIIFLPLGLSALSVIPLIIKTNFTSSAALAPATLALVWLILYPFLMNYFRNRSKNAITILIQNTISPDGSTTTAPLSPAPPIPKIPTHPSLLNKSQR